MLMTILATIVVVGVLILVHELGHFAAAKLVGIRVVRFSLGLGPKLWGVKRGETEYVLSWIPLGGYVKMGGMDDEVLELVEGGGGGEGGRGLGERDFDARPLWARTLVVSAGVLMNLVFAFLVYAVLLGVWGVPEPATTRLGRVDASRVPVGAEALARLEPGAQIVRVGGRRVERWSGLRDALLRGRGGATEVELADGRTLAIRIPGDRGERVRLAEALLPWQDPVITAVNPGSPAERAGLRGGDRIVAVDGGPVRSWYEFQDAIRARPETPVELTVLRDGREIVRSVTPLGQEARDAKTGAKRTVGLIGVFSAPEMVRTEVGALRAVELGARQTWGTTVLILDFLRDLLLGDVSPRSVGSIVAIGEMSGRVARQGVEAFLGFLAFFSVNLAILNLLPIPILDGGHLLFLSIEAVRGRALTVEQRVRWSHVGFIIVVGLMLWALSNDVLRLLGL